MQRKKASPFFSSRTACAARSSSRIVWCVVLTRPGKIDKIIDIGLPRPYAGDAGYRRNSQNTAARSWRYSGTRRLCANIDRRGLWYRLLTMLRWHVLQTMSIEEVEQRVQSERARQREARADSWRLSIPRRGGRHSAGMGNRYGFSWCARHISSPAPSEDPGRLLSECGSSASGIVDYNRRDPAGIFLSASSSASRWRLAIFHWPVFARVDLSAADIDTGDAEGRRRASVYCVVQLWPAAEGVHRIPDRVLSDRDQYE